MLPANLVLAIRKDSVLGLPETLVNAVRMKFIDLLMFNDPFYIFIIQSCIFHYYGNTRWFRWLSQRALHFHSCVHTPLQALGFLFFFFLRFIYFREWEGEGGRLPSRLRNEHRARCGTRSHDPEIMSRVETKSWELSQLHHSCTPGPWGFFRTQEENLINVKVFVPDHFLPFKSKLMNLQSNTHLPAQQIYKK